MFISFGAASRDTGKERNMRNNTWKELLLMNSTDDWFMALLFVLGGWLLGQVVSRVAKGLLGRWAARSSTGTDDMLLRELRSPVVLIITVLGFLFGYQHLNWPAKADLWVWRALHVAIAVSFTWLIARLATRLLGEYLHRGQTNAERRGTAIPALTGVVNVLIWGLGLVVALSNAGYDVGALLAGIGIGGLAMAMAAKDTLANIFGGISLFADEPFTAGDRVRIGEHTGRVEAIGLRSTRLRTAEGPVVVIPNHLFTESMVVNLSAERTQRVRLDIGIDRSMPAEQVARALDVLGSIVNGMPDVLEPEHVASLHDLRPDHLGVILIYHVKKHHPIDAARTRINLEVLRRFQAEGIRMAHPTSVQFVMDGPPA